MFRISDFVLRISVQGTVMLPTLNPYNPHPSLFTPKKLRLGNAANKFCFVGPKLLAKQEAKDEFGLLPFRSPLLRECIAPRYCSSLKATPIY